MGMGVKLPNDAIMNDTEDVDREVTLMKRQQGQTGQADIKLMSFSFVQADGKFRAPLEKLSCSQELFPEEWQRQRL